MPGLDELFDQKIQQSTGSAKEPIGTESFQSIDPFLQDYNKSVTSDKSLAGLMGANVEQGGLGDVSYFDEGRVYNNGNLDKARAANQPWYDKWGRAALKIVPGVVLGIGEIAGHLLDFENYASMATGAQNNYDNWFSEGMRNLRSGLDEAMPVYQRDAGKAWDPGDTGWWANNVSGLVESMAEFFAVNALTGGTVGAISKGSSIARAAVLARNAKLARNISKMTPDKIMKAQAAIDKGTDVANMFNNVAQAGSAFEMGVAVSSMNATGTYQEVYNTAKKSINPLTNKQYTEEEAIKIASDSAATSFNTGLVFNSVLNYTSITPFFRGKAIPPKSKLAPIAGESTDDMLIRLKDLKANPEKLNDASKWYDKWYADAALEMGQEAVEEYGEALAGKIGVNQGMEKITGEKQEMNYFSEDMLVAAGLGMLGGGVGKGFKSFFDRNNDSKLQDSLIKEVDYRIQNIETYKTAQTNLAKAKAENNEVEVAKAEEQLFTNQLFDAIVNDNVETFVQQMEEIGKLSREDAKAKGFFADETDDLNEATSGDYRVKANAAIDLVKKGKVIATAVQQDGYLQTELKPLVLREQLNAAFNEHVADGLKKDIAALEMKEVKYNSAGEPIAQPWVYGGNLQAKVDAIDSLVFREEQAIEQGKGNPKTLEHLKSKQSLFKAQLQQHINDQTAVGKKYDPTLSRQGLNYLQLSRKYRELMSVETAGLNSRNKLTKLISLENQKATVEHLKNVERRLPKKVEIANKAKELMGKFFSLPSDADPQSKKEIMDQLNALLDSGAMQALDYVDPNDESGQSEFDTRQEILEEILGSMQSPEDLKRFIDEADLGSTEITYDENNQPITTKVDDGTVQHRRKVFDENGNPVLENVESTDVNGNPITTQRQTLENVGSKTTLADLFGRMQDINNRSNELRDTGLASDEDGKVNPFKALLLAMSETFDEDVKQTIAENKDKVKIAREKEKAKREEFAKDIFEQNYDEFISELGILEDMIMPNEFGKIQEKFGALANRLLEMYGPAYLPVLQKIYSAITAMIPQFDTRYSNMSINQILEGVGGINENFVLPVVFSTRVLYKGKPIVRTEEGGYHYGTAKAIGEIEGEKLKHVPGTIEVINGKVVFIPESAIGLDDKAEYAVELSADALTKPLSELNIGVKMQESYDIQLAVSEDGNTALINFGGKSFKLSDINPENDFFFDESGEFLTGLYIEDADGIGHIITDPAMLTDLINIIGNYKMLFQEYAENNFKVSVVNVFGKKSVYKVVDFNAVKPEESVVVTDTGVDISHHKLKSEGGALTIKGRVLNELKRKFINDVVKKLSDEISQQQTTESIETQGDQTDGQGPESQVDNQNNQRVRESQERIRRKEFTEEQKSKIDKYRDKYESKIKDLINSQDAEGLQQEFDKFEKISNYSGTSDEVIAQVEAAKAAMRLIYNGMKVINKSLEERGNDAVNNSKKVPTDKLDTKGFESANAGKDLYHDENGTDESPSILNNDFKLVTDGLEVKSKESLATPKQNDMAVVSDGEYTYVINYNNGKWEPVIVTDNNGSAAIVQKDSDKVKYIKPDGSQGEWDKSKFESNLSKFIAKPDITVHTISRDDAGKVWRKINDKLKNPKDTKEKQTQTVKKDLQVAGTRKDGVKLFTTPNVTESWQPPGRPNKYTVVSLNSTNTPTGVTINDEFITQQGLDMLHNPNVTSETHFVRFKAIENNWWKSQSDDTKKLRNELTPIYVELVDKLTGESVIVSRLASASKNGNLLPERSAILEALDKGQEVTAEIANEYGQNRMFSMQKDGYVHVLNIFDNSGAPVFYSMSDPNNGLVNTWQLTKDGSFSKENKPSEIVLLTTKGMDANKSFGKSEKLQIDTKNQMSNADPKVRTALKQQLPSIDISNFTEGQIMMPMVTPAGVVTVVPLSTAYITNDIINDFFLSPLKKMNGNAVSADDFDSFVENLRQIVSVDSKPSKDPQSFFQVDKVIKDGKMIGSNIKFWSKKHNSYLTVALSNREGLSGLIHSLQNNLPIKATVTTINGKGDFKGSKNTVDITSDDLMEVMAERKMNVQRDRLNSTAKFSITNPTTGEVQEFNSYNEFVMGLPSTDNKPNMLINDKKKSGPMTSILNHNFMNNNGTVFNGAGVVMNNLSVEVKKEKKQQQQPQQKPGEKKQERRTVTPKPVQGKSFNEVKKAIDEIQKVPKTIAVVGDISKKPADDAAEVITSAYGENPAIAKRFLNNFGVERAKITINDNVKISGTTVELLGKIDENTDEFKKLVRETYRYGLDLVVNGKLVASSINNKGKYVNLNTGQVYKRVTSVIKDKEFEGNALTDTAVDIGNKVDTILRKAFTLSSKGKFIFFTDLATGNLISKEKLQSSMQSEPEKFPTTDVNEMYEFLKEVHDIRLAMEKRNELPFADNILLHNDELGIAGTVDLLTLDPSGTIRIYDFKTMRGNKLATTYEGKSESKYDTEFDGMSDRQYHQQQLSMYRILLANSYGLVADGLAIMPIEVNYTAGDTHSTTLKRATDPETNSKWIIHEPLDTVKGISINYPDGYLPVAEEVQEEEDAKNYEAEKQDSEKKPLVNKKSDTNGQVIEKTDAKLKGTKKSLSADAVISEITEQGKKEEVKEQPKVEIILGGLVGGYKAISKNSFDVRSDNSIMTEISKQNSFAKIIVKNGKKYAVVGLALETKRPASTVGRDNYSFAMVEMNESTPNNIIEILEQNAKENFKNIYRDFNENDIVKPISTKDSELKTLESKQKTESKPLRPTPKVEQQTTSTFDPNDTEISKGALVNYNDKTYILWGTTAKGNAQLYDVELGQKFSGTPKLDNRFTSAGGKYKSVTHSNGTDYIYVDGKIISLATGLSSFENPTDPQRTQILNKFGITETSQSQETSNPENRKNQLLKLKDLVATTDDLESVMNDIFKVLDEKKYEDWQEKLDSDQLEKDLRIVLNNVSAKDSYNAISKFLLPKFIDSELSSLQQTTELNKTTPTEPTPSALDSLFSLGADMNTDEDEDISFEDKGANNPINLQEFEGEQSKPKPDSRIGKVYTSAVKAFSEAKEDDEFILTTVVPSTRGHFTGKKDNMVENRETVVKKGDYFVPWSDALNKPENEQRKWDPKDLDKNNNKISLEFDGIFNKDVPFRRSNSTEAVIDTKKAGKWLRSRGIPFDESRQIIQVAQNANNAKVHGYFHNGLVYISSTAEVGTEYHEAFHAVFRTWNNDSQQRQLLDEAKSIYPQPTAEELQDLRELYPSLNDSQIEDLYYEEVLSEKFRQYVITNQKPRTITERIWKFIKDLFNYLKTYTSNKRTIDQLFSNIESGMINKQFTRVSQKAEKMYSRDKKGFNNKTRDHITNAITSAFVQKYDFAKNNGNDKPRASEIFKEIKDDFAIAGVERLASCTQLDDADYSEFVKIANNLGYDGDNGVRDLKIKMGAVFANVLNDLQTTGRMNENSFLNVPGVNNNVGNMMMGLLKQQFIGLPSLAITEKRLGHKISNESFAEVQKQYKEKKITAAEFNEINTNRKAVLEAITYFGVNNTWNSVKRDDDGFLLPEPGWIELASNQLNEFGLRVKGEISMEEIEAGEEKVYSRDSVEENRADMLSGKLKNFLARVPKPTAAGKILGIIPYNNRQETTAKFQALLTQSGGVSSMSQMLSILETASKTDPLVKNLYTEILKTMNSNKMEDKLMLNELYTLAAMTYRNFHSFQVRKSWKKDGFNLDVINFDSNSKRLTKKLVNDWKNNSYRPGSIYKVNESGEVTVDAMQLSALKAEFAKFNKKPKYELAELTAISNAFKILGVEIPVDTLQKAMQTGIKKSKDIIKGKNVIDYITKDYSNSYKSSGRGFEAVISELSKGKDMHLTDISFFKKAAEVEGQFGGVENMSFTNSQGKNIFPINMHTAFTRNMGAIAFYGEGNDIQDAWLDSISLDPKVSFKSSSGVVYESPLYKLRNIPDSVYFTTLDAYKTSGEEHSNTAFQDFNEVNEWLYRLNAFANNGDKSSMYVMAPTIGDRSSNMLVKLPRIGFNKVASEYQSDVKTMLSTMIVQDIKSMQQAYEDIIMNTDKDGNLDTTNLVMYYHYNKDKQGNIIPGNWNKFSQLQFLNNTAAGKELIKLFSTTDDQQFLTDIKKADSLVNKAVADSIQYIESKTKDVVQRLSDLKIHEQVLKEKNGKTKLVDIKNPLDLKNYNSIEEFVKDFVTADLIMKNEIKKFTGADQLAYKGGAVEEYSKRMGHIMTPGTESAIEGEVVNEEYFVEFGDKPDYTMAIVDDVFSEDDSYEFMMALKDVPGVNSAAIEERIDSTYGKNKSNKTDAMGYTTIHKHRAKLLGTRGWSPKHEEAYQNYNKGLEFAVYDKFGNVIQRPTLNPLKTYHDGIYNHNGKNVRVIVKHSTFPLLREFTKSHPRFEKLRARMEAEGEYSTLEPIDEVNHISGVKTGIINSNNTTAKVKNTEIFKGFWKRSDVESQQDKVFLFGDNTDDRLNTKYVPSSTQAVIRGLPNAIGIDTKKNRGTADSSYFTDADFGTFKLQVDNAIQSAKNSGKTIVVPEDGIGTGKAMLKEKAPKLFDYLQQELNKLKEESTKEFDFAEMKPMPFKLETKNQRIPQVIPDRVKVNKLGSQTMKLAPAGLSEFAESDYDIAGVNLKGKDVFDKYQQVLTSMQQNQIDNFYDRMGYNPEGFESMTSDEKLKFFNNFRRILKTVVEERGLSNNYLKTLDIVPDGRGGFEFAVPMAHPAYSKKFEQMMVSLFKNGPLTLPVNGKAFVQIAEFGTHVKDNSLKFIHSKGGKTIEAAEIAIPWEMADKMGLPKDENGDYDLSKLDQRLLTLVGYRIPTQGKSAMLPMKIKRILPKSMGKVILVPGEITAQMGSDFDVDKLYTLMPNYKVEYDAGSKKYNRTDEFGAHIMSRLDYKDKKAFTNTFTPDFIEQLWNNPEIIEDYITDINTDKSTEDLIEAVIKAKEDTIDDMKAMGVSDKPKAVYAGYDINNVANNTQAQLENMLLDLTHGILKSPNHLQDVLSPVDSNTAPNLKKIAAGFIKGEKAMVNKLDANDPFTEITLALRNRVGKAGIGMYAVNMTGAAVAEYSDCQLAPQFEIKANGKVFNMLNRVKDDNGVPVIYSFSKHLTMAVDNAKDPQMAFLNDSLDTATVTSLFIRSGIVVPALANKLTEKLLKANINDAYSKAKTQEEKDDLNKLAEIVKSPGNLDFALQLAKSQGIVDFTSAKDLDFDGGPVEVATVMRLQPAVLKLIQEMQNNGYVNIEDGIAEMFLKYKSGIKDLKDAKTKAQKFLKEFKGTTMLDYVSMVDNIGNQPNLDDSKQLEILGNWALLSRAAREMMQVNKVIYNTDVIKNDMSSVAKISEIEDIKESLFTNEKPAVIGWTPNYPIAAKYSDTLDLMKDFISNFMPQGNDSFSVLGGSVKELVNKKTLKEEHYQELGKFVMPYLLAQPGSPVAKYFTPEFYGPLLYKGLGHRDNIVKQLNTVKTMILSDALPDLKDNKFLTLLDEHPDNKKSYKEEPILALKFETAGKITSSEQDDIIEDFHQLFNHPNEIVRKFADSLLAYNIVAKGLRSGVDSFADLIPIDVLNEKIDGKESINEYVRRVANSAFLERVYKSAATFIENNSHIDGLVGWVPSNAIMEFKDEDMIESNFLVPVDIATVEENKIQLPTYGFMYNDGKKELMKLVDIEGESYYSSREVINNNGKPVVTTIPIQKGVPYKMLNINNDVQGMVGLAQQIAEENEEYFEC